MFAEYRNERTKLRVGFALFGPAAVKDAAASPGTSVLRASGGVYKWQTGQETVVVLKHFIARAEVSRIQAAMNRTSPQASLAETLPMLSRTVILGLAKDLPSIAGRYAPEAGRTVAIGPKLASSIPNLAKRGKPLRDTRTAYLTHIPWKHGMPDYANAIVQWPYAVAVTTSGVRAIAAVQRRAKCPGCIVLLNQQNGVQYSIWEIAPAPPYAAARYSVDGKTLTVTQVQ